MTGAVSSRSFDVAGAPAPSAGYGGRRVVAGKEGVQLDLELRSLLSTSGQIFEPGLKGGSVLW